jgi:hypothetical protein
MKKESKAFKESEEFKNRMWSASFAEAPVHHFSPDSCGVVARAGRRPNPSATNLSIE